ncbi:ExbD/TolR family protein [Methanobrevibacter curvatus]|uniref:Biopolymer transport protein ExbD/TolR n=1 Tax=Methanobrevibacter curvatus TaxID=49547 RepID=A0A166A4M6_9EURY|nr:biopolymer transporter ExbD [Methanobrevibacter curvatus]KZX11558.1 biopolymer transport protein ExbD/TolR [Methanobrevibacter curvatus]
MALDIQKHRAKMKDSKPSFNMVPLIDILFTILIFLVVANSFTAGAVDDSGKPESTPSQGPSEYYLFPVAGLQKVIVNGQDMSSLIKDSSIAIHTKVIDEGDIQIKAKERTILITTPPGMAVNKAVQAPNS